MDLYTTLGLKKDATREEIRAAYRKLSKKHHPDSPTGDDKAFMKVKEAHDVLTDDDERAFYDETGQIKTRAPEGAEEAEIGNLVSSIFFNALGQIHDVDRKDLRGVMLGLLSTQVASIDGQIKQHQQHVDKLGKAAKRLKFKGENNVLARTIKWSVVASTDTISKLQQNLVTINKAKDIISNYEYEYENNESEFEPYRDVFSKRGTIW